MVAVIGDFEGWPVARYGEGDLEVSDRDIHFSRPPDDQVVGSLACAIADIETTNIKERVFMCLLRMLSIFPMTLPGTGVPKQKCQKDFGDALYGKMPTVILPARA